MSDGDDCSSCPQSRTCKTVYEQIGKAQGPSVTAKAIAVFLGPIAVFVICLAVLENRLTALTGASVGLLLTVLISVFASLLYILLAGMIMQRITPHESSCRQKEQNANN